MSQNITSHLDSIKKKIKGLHSANHALRSETEKLNGQLAIKTQRIKDLEDQLKAQRSEIESLKLARAYEEGNGADKEARSRINEMVREIDRCIALLNN